MACVVVCVPAKTSVTAGTIFARTHPPLRVWFAAIWYVVNQSTGLSARVCSACSGLGSYETAWKRLHKLRRAMILPGRDVLSGRVEIDESYIGARRPGGRRRGSGKAMVAIAIEVRTALGRVRMARIPDVTATR